MPPYPMPPYPMPPYPMLPYSTPWEIDSNPGFFQQGSDAF